MKKSDHSHQQTIVGNLSQWCFELDSEFQKFNSEAAAHFHDILTVLRRPLHVVELGCGDGASLRTFKQLGIDTLGVDINQEKLDKVPTETIKQDMLAWLKAQPDASVENLFSHHALEHVGDIDQVLRQSSRVLKPGGLFYAVVPAQDTVHEVHYIAFDQALELLPPDMTALLCADQQRHNANEFICLALK